MSRGKYSTAQLADRIQRRLSDRDLAIVATLDSLRLATTLQLRRLHFTDLSPASAARQAPKALARLAGISVLTTLPRTVGGVRAGSAAVTWALDRSGQRVASATGPAGGTRLRSPWMPSLPFVAHRLLVSELFVELTEAARSGSCEILAFEAEPLSWRRFPNPHGGWAYVKPDATVRLGVGEYERGAFVEIDRGTEATTTVARKAAAFRRYWESGREQARFGYFPRVVFSVPTEARKEALAAVCARQPAETWPLFRVVLRAELTDALIGGTP